MAERAGRVASTRHLTCDAEEAVVLGVGLANLSPQVAAEAFTGEPVKMVRALSRWAARKYVEMGENPDYNIRQWAIREGRGVHNPDPGRYQRNADMVAA